MGKAEVYFISLADGTEPSVQAKAISKLIKASAADSIVEDQDYVAVKVHVGEKGNTTHVKPEVVRAVVKAMQVRGGQVFLTETATLYKGERDNAVRHLMHANNQGFSVERIGAPFIMADGLMGDNEVEVAIDCELHKKVKVAREAVQADVIVAVSHPTGHPLAGLGATIKNLGMGMASRLGKLRQHSTMKPAIKESVCKKCGKCQKWCPEAAIDKVAGKFVVNESKCVGCGECLAVCRFDAVEYDWATDLTYMQRSMAEHAYGAVKNKPGKCFYFNVLTGMTKDCDCFGVDQPKLIPDIGILCSSDPVAIDKATLDLTAIAHGKNLAVLAHDELDPMLQIRHAAEIGMGTMEYELITIE